MRLHGSCHCGRVSFVVEAPEDALVQECNCSICAKTGFLHLIVPRGKFRIEKGEDQLTLYTFHTGVE